MLVACYYVIAVGRQFLLGAELLLPGLLLAVQRCCHFKIYLIKCIEGGGQVEGLVMVSSHQLGEEHLYDTLLVLSWPT